MGPAERFVISFAAEPPQEAIPYGRWADTLGSHFAQACRDLDSEGLDLGEAGEVAWFPDRSFSGRTYVPAVARTTTGYELFGFVSFVEGEDGAPRAIPTGSSTSTTMSSATGAERRGTWPR
jgi:hypothetical protein